MLEDISALHISTARPKSNMDSNATTVATTVTEVETCSLSSLESESDLSMAFERDVDEPTDIDELPVFEIRAYSPHGRTPSPIDEIETDVMTPKLSSPQRSPGRKNNPEFVALHEINAQICAPSDNVNDSAANLSRSNSLETIFEGVFLHTPPREKLNNSAGSNSNSCNRYTPKRSRVNLMELVAMNRLQTGGKENQSPRKERQDEFT
ncbi:uncharacterized protein LOC108599207 [Drosophila busckii]|uniref:uncharacterized protein LOC108599207 n=1 Tax=Drosophila busckii TaxID=30019 RepID=UPI00143303E4|nr:uncharacterized protein LOC108599207 [Drosophila busckii]